MTYVYDIILNFNDKLYDFYEWEKNDNYLHIKKVNVIRVNSKIYNEILDNKVKFNGSFWLTLLNKCEYYDKRVVKTLPYVFLLTDTYRTMALMLNDNLEVIKYSSLLLDEEEEVNEISSRIPLIKLEYNIIKENSRNDLTRNEELVCHYIINDLKETYENKDFAKLRYLYYEYFNIESNDLEKNYQELLLTLKEFNHRHYKLYNLIQLSYNTASSRIDK